MTTARRVEPVVHRINSQQALGLAGLYHLAQVVFNLRRSNLLFVCCCLIL